MAEEHGAVVEARRVIAELEQEAIRLAAAEKRLQVAVEQVGVRMKAMDGRAED